MILFTTLGELAAGDERHRRPITSAVRRLIYALLAANHGQAVSADRLMYAVWPDEAPDLVRNRLWFHISKLRSELGQIELGQRLETLPVGYRLAMESGELDASVFETRATEGRRLLQTDAAAAIRRLRRSLEMWRGDAFAEAGGHPALSATVVRLEELRIRAGEDLGDALIDVGAFADAVTHLEAMLTLDPYRERLRSLLMHALYGDGRQVEALRVYDESIALLVEELGVDPSPVLRSMAQRVLRHDPTLVRSTAASGPKLLAGRNRVFVGRDQTVVRLLQEDGHVVPGVTLISGEAGAGKTALLAEVAGRATSEHPELLVAAGMSPAGLAGIDAFGPLRQVLEALVGDLETAVVSNLQSQANVDALWASSWLSLTALVETGPALIGTVLDPAAVQARAAATNWERRRLIDAAVDAAPRRGLQQPGLLRQVLSMLTQVAKQVPLLLLLDDLHRADEVSIETLGALAESPANGKLSVLGAVRSDAPLDAGWKRLNAAVRAQSGGGVIDMDLTTLDERLAFVDAVIDLRPNDLDARFRRRLAEVTGGRALFVVEWLRNLTERGALVEHNGRIVETPHVELEEWPTQIDAVLEERFARYDPAELRLLRVAAVDGIVFRADVVARATARDLSDVVGFLSRGDVPGHHVVVADVPARIGTRRVLRYRFRHPLFHRFLYAGLDAAERPLLHEGVARAIEDLGGGSDDARAIELAGHYEQAGLMKPAIDNLRRAAARSMRAGDAAAAAGLLERAIRLAEGSSVEGHRLLAGDLYLSLGVARSTIEGFTAPTVEAAFTRGLEHVDDGADWVDPMRALFGLWSMEVSRARFPEARDLLDRMQASQRAPIGHVVPVLHARWSQDLFEGDLGAALRSTRAGRDRYRFGAHHALTYLYGNHDPGVCARVLGAVALALAGEVDAARQWISDARSLAASISHPPSSSQARAVGMLVEHLAGDHEAIVAAAEAQWEPVAPLWDTLAEAMILNASGVLRLEPVVDELQQVLERGIASADAIFSGVVGSVAALQWLTAGDPARAANALAGARSLLADPEAYFYAAEMTRVEALIAGEDGDLSGAASLLERSVAIASAQGAGLFETAAAADLAQLSR